MGGENKVYSYDEISLHSTAKDCWIVINAKIYDVTNFFDDHPGGADVLLEAAGKDASEEFEAVGHGSSARLMLDEYYVAEVDPSNKPIPKSAPLPVSVPVSVKGTSSSSTIVKFLLFFFPLIILGFAISIRLYTSANSKPTH
ncbi:hypothetical protein M9H77_36628 [Catharanthus roseus]|uniref:Uncharacterized protein n=1 Tax=Catharanthus roseus TaxID=4058 RepID=A0ACB9ZT54_CATRO|nr:hypothetical protein M9H77_36628 [Catharanthus roseus]